MRRSCETAATRSRRARSAGGEPAPSTVLRVGGLAVDPLRRQAELDGVRLDLTRREFDLLAFLAAHPGRAFSREELMDHVWQHPFYSDTATVTVHVRRLRAKIERDPERPRFIETVWGVGYRFAP